MMKTACFALLDDALSADSDKSSRLYEYLVEDLCCEDPSGLADFWAGVVTAQDRGLHAVVLGDYEWGARLQGVEASGGVFRVLLFRQLKKMTHAEVTDWLDSHDSENVSCDSGNSSSAAWLGRLQPSNDCDDFAGKVGAIHDAIRAGETYQINYTFRLDGHYFGSALSLYRRLRRYQPVGYGAFISLPTEKGLQYVLSCSPELFVEFRDQVLRTRPMKGTAASSGDPGVDDDRAQALSNDPKNRAENLMIVDLLRNDMGRIANTGTVRVAELFQVEHYSTVLQMTSTVEAQPKPGTDFPAILRALFPCGSITGAPKLQTMRHIAKLEDRPRGLYTGCLGWIDRPVDPLSSILGEFCLSVPIRTLLLSDGGLDSRRVELGVGAGIVIDSDPGEEYQECLLKARFASVMKPDFELFETLLLSPEGEIVERSRHLSRLIRSARDLGFECRLDILNAALDQAVEKACPGEASRLRMSLSFDGRVSIISAALDALEAGPLRLVLAPGPLRSTDGLLRYKTSRRLLYDQAIRSASAEGAFDMLFYDESGRITEGARSNVFLLLNGEWLTPSLSSGMVLPGTMRERVLEDRAWKAREADLSLLDLARADRVLITNALRGAFEVEVQGDPSALMSHLAQLPVLSMAAGLHLSGLPG